MSSAVDVPVKSGCGPVDWFQTHNVRWTEIGFRQWCYIFWHYITAFGVMYAVLTWAQEAELIDSMEELKAWKGLAAAFTGLVLYWLLPHRMYHFFRDAPYSDRTPRLRDVAGIANASTWVQQGQDREIKFTTTVVSGPEGHYRIAVPYPALEKAGALPAPFEIETVPYAYLFWRQWAWIIWHYLSSFAVMFAVLTWFQECDVLEHHETFDGWKGLLSVASGLILYWLMPHRMYHFHEAEPLSE